ncbi:MAG: AAA family ATPase [Ignavibacteria bacterium]|nr:AAA family ATPase [Ignavibacteria bacterium]
MIPDQEGNLIFSKGLSTLTRPGTEIKDSLTIDFGGILESRIKNDSAYRTFYLKDLFSSFKIFHFHDTSSSSRMRQSSGTNDYAYLYEDGGNIAAFLYRLQESKPVYFNIIEKIIQSIAPFFDRFYLKPDEINSHQIFLRWLEKGSDKLFNAYSLSDGTLRMICLTTLLNQPEPPSTIIIDEPELGLHPFAITKIAAMIKSASVNTQIIISTQSVSLLDQFDANDVIVVNRENNQTVFKRQNADTLSDWLEEYTLGEIWDKNLIGGRP